MSSINAAAISAKHRGNAEGSVRVLGQTAAVAGISGALLLALKAMVLVSPAVLPGGDGLDALGRPNAVTAPAVPAPVVFEPASADMPIGASERTAPSITRTVVTIPNTTSKPVIAGVNQPTTPSTPSTPGTPSTPSTPAAPGTVGTVTKPVTDLVDGLIPGVGSTVGGVVATVDKVAKPVTDTVKSLPVVGGVVGTVEETVAGDSGLVSNLTGTVGNTVGGVTGGTSTGSGGALAPVTGVVGGLTGGLLK
jgi:hypothetical protein